MRVISNIFNIQTKYCLSHSKANSPLILTNFMIKQKPFPKSLKCYSMIQKSITFQFSVIQDDNNQNNHIAHMPSKQKKIKSQLQEIPILKQIMQIAKQSDLHSIYKKFPFMSKQHRQIALRYLLSTIYTGKIPFKVIQQAPMQILLKQFSHLKAETQLFLINIYLTQLKAKIKQTSTSTSKNQQNVQNKNSSSSLNKNQNDKYYNDKINDLFYNCFSNTLKQISQQHVDRTKAVLYKHFAEYNFQFLFNPSVNASDQNSAQFKQNYSLLKKSKDFLIQSLIFHKQLILSQYKRLSDKQITQLQENDKERYLIKMNAIKQNIRRLIQSMSECLYASIMIATKQYKWTNNVQKFNQDKFQVSGLIQSYISLYSIFSGIKPLSKLYFKLRAMAVDCKATAFASMINTPKHQLKVSQLKLKFKDTLLQNKMIYKQCQDYLPQISQNFDRLKQLSTVMLTLKYKIGKSQHQSSQVMRKQLALVVHSILQKVNPQWKKPTQIYLLKLLKEILKREENMENQVL